jgi:thymidylate synthase (FAD)
MFRLVKPHAKIEEYPPRLLEVIEKAGRTCYKSEDKIDPHTAKAFIRKILKRGHESVIEHGAITVRFICDRGVTHELVRHRLAAYSQESTRYCDYAKPGSKPAVTFVVPPWLDGSIKRGAYKRFTDGESGEYVFVLLDYVGSTSESVLERGSVDEGSWSWMNAMAQAAIHYTALRDSGWSPQQARSVLPNSLKTEIVMTANPREWRHVFHLRTSGAAHPQMREVMIPLLGQFVRNWPVLFEDLLPDKESGGG